MELFKKVQSLLAYNADRVHIDGLSSKLHYRLTATLLFICAVLVTSHQFIGDPIDCISRSSVPLDRLDRFCWVQKTFSANEHWYGEVGTAVAYPGVARTRGDVVYHAYYQWVCFALFLQSLLFYLPHRLWKLAEGGRVKRLVKLVGNQLDDSSKLEAPLRLVSRYLNNYRGEHRLYGVCFVVCELLNLANVVAQLFLMDAFLDGKFFRYGFDVMRFSQWQHAVRFDPMLKRFPRVTQCTLHFFGSGGGLQDVSAMCFLHVNILNEKIFLVLWFWFGFVLLATIGSLLHLAMVVVNFGDMRWRCLCSKDLGFDYSQKARSMAGRADFGDFVVLHLLSKNIDRIPFSSILKATTDAFDDMQLRSIETTSCFKERFVDSSCTKTANGNHKSHHIVKRSSVTDL